MAHEERLSVHDVDPKATQAVLGLEKYVQSSGLDKRLYELVKIRASQLNGCAYCVDLHSHDARALGESEQRVVLVAVWREAGVFTAQEQAALALTESLTQLSSAREVPDDVYEQAREAFTPEQFGAVAWAATTINAYNRLGVLGQMHPPAR
jgi:AhpD family alkylhydroperoxidase